MDFIHQESILSFKELVQNAARVAVVGHTHPDGDALGATTAMALHLLSMGKKETACLFPDSPGENLQFILSPDVPYLFHDREAEKTEAFLRGADLIILLDANAFNRTEGLEPLLEASAGKKVLMDHHLNPDRDAFDLAFSTPDISSASELLYWVLRTFSDSLPVPIGEALMAGMTTDTNNFANSVYPSTFRMASELMASGVDRDALLQKIYNNYRENRVRLMGYMQNEGLRLLPSGGAYMILTREIQQRFDLREGESEGLVNIPLTIARVRLSILLREAEGHFRVSIRSKKGTSAQELARRFFHGGGHENASGGKLFIGPDIPSAQEADRYVENALNTFLK